MDQYDLIVRAKAGDEAAFEALFHACYAPVFRYVFTRVKQRDDAEDITQEVFAKFLASLARYEHTSPSLLPYLFVIARNAVIDHARKRRPEIIAEEHLWRIASQEPTPEEAAAMGEESAAALALLAKLPENDANVVRMKYLDGRSTREIGEALGKSEEAIRQILSRSIRYLRSLSTSPGSKQYGPTN